MSDPHAIKIYDKYIKRHGITDRLSEYDFPDSDMIVVIPAYIEKDYIFDCLDSLSVSAVRISGTVSVIVVVNATERSAVNVIREQEELFRSLVLYSAACPNIRVFPIKEFNFRKKHAGVGAARKLGMDQAVYWFRRAGVYDGVIVSLDADTVVAPNYFEELQEYFLQDKVTGCSIYFEHPLEGHERDAIALYELYLRYYKNALKFSGFPYAFHTVGSAFAMRATNYVMAGGMPRKQAGEDFYLIQKVVQSGGYGELNTTCVYPSSRPSDRVPFGTGPSVKKMLNEKTGYKTYNQKAFYDLKNLFENRMSLYGISPVQFEKYVDKLPESVRDFLIRDSFYDDVVNLSSNCSSQDVFNKRFFELFNAFKVVKCLNFVHNGYYEKEDVVKASVGLLKLLNVVADDYADVQRLLWFYRELDKKVLIKGT